MKKLASEMNELSLSQTKTRYLFTTDTNELPINEDRCNDDNDSKDLDDFYNDLCRDGTGNDKEFQGFFSEDQTVKEDPRDYLTSSE